MLTHKPSGFLHPCLTYVKVSRPWVVGIGEGPQDQGTTPAKAGGRMALGVWKV